MTTFNTGFYESVGSVGSVWVDGRYIEANHAFYKGDSFDMHPTAGIIVRNMTYTNYDKETFTGDVLFDYDEKSGTWNAESEYGYHGSYVKDPDTGKLKWDYNANYELPEGVCAYSGRSGSYECRWK